MNAYAKLRKNQDTSLPLQDFLNANMERLDPNSPLPWYGKQVAPPPGVPKGHEFTQGGVSYDVDGFPIWKVPPAEEQGNVPLFERVENAYGRMRGGPQ